MLCKNVLHLLSEFSDEVLDAGVSVEISQHLDRCGQCRKEYESLSLLQGKLRSLKGIQAPEFLDGLVEHRITDSQKNSWRRDLRNELERRWSIIRTTERMWYVSKALGAVMTSLLFFLICGNSTPPLEPAAPDFRQPVIDEGYLNDVGETMSQSGRDDELAVWTEVDPSGSARIQKVIERPYDQKLLINVNETIGKAHCRPASKNGKAIPSHMLFIFNKISVYSNRIPGIS
jgi:hypothetical protein